MFVHICAYIQLVMKPISPHSTMNFRIQYAESTALWHTAEPKCVICSLGVCQIDDRFNNINISKSKIYKLVSQSTHYTEVHHH